MKKFVCSFLITFQVMYEFLPFHQQKVHKKGHTLEEANGVFTSGVPFTELIWKGAQVHKYTTEKQLELACLEDNWARAIRTMLTLCECLSNKSHMRIEDKYVLPNEKKFIGKST